MNEDIIKLFEKANTIKLNPACSSNVKGIGYNSDNKLLVVLFNGGNKYLYENVEPEVYKTIISSESVGKALNECVVRNKAKYKYHKLNSTNTNK